MILLLGNPSNQILINIQSKLQKRQADSICFNLAQFPAKSEIATSYSMNGKPQSRLEWNSQKIDLYELHSIFYWHTDFLKLHSKFTNEFSKNGILGEAWRAIDDTLNILNVQWIPGPYEKIRLAQFKVLQLKTASKLNFLLPPTLITNSPQDLLKFYTEHNGRIISKAIGTTLNKELSPTFSRYTEIVSNRDINYAYTIRYCPIIFQAYIPKHIELRIIVVGQQVFAASIDSQSSNRTRHDCRHYDYYTTNHEIYTLPDEIKKQCGQLVEKMGLTYGAIDMILTPDGRYVFLEINPAGQYGWIEEATGLPITDAICDLLIAGK